MSQHEAKISGSKENGFYALIVRIDRDGEEHVIRGYEGRHFKTQANAEKSTGKYITKFCA